LGGLIAHSIAGQIESQGMHVEMLALIDSYVFTAVERVRSRTEAEEVQAALSFLNIHLLPEHTPQTLRELHNFLLHPGNARSIPQVQGAIKLAREIGKSDPEFIHRLSAVMLNNLKLARQYAPQRVNSDVLYFHATEITGDLDGILDRNPSAWKPFVHGMQVHELACHHEAVMNPLPAAQIASALQQRFAVEEKAIATAWA
jgi:enterobactin synthetase component F